MYLDWRGEWSLPLLNGIASAPLLGMTGPLLWSRLRTTRACGSKDVPDLAGLRPGSARAGPTPKRPSVGPHSFKTFCFGDAQMQYDATAGVPVVVDTETPGRDETAFLAGRSLAVCRPSFAPCPRVLFRAAPLSGAGSGEGLLARCICIIAFGHEPHAVTGGGMRTSWRSGSRLSLSRVGPRFSSTT